MKLNLESDAKNRLVRAYTPGQLRIGDGVWQESVIIAPSMPPRSWRPGSMLELQASDLAPLLALRPEVLLFGSGLRQQFPERSVLADLYAARIGFEIMDTGAACRTYNVLIGEGRAIAAALMV
jgi:uncharacterized protein